MHLQRCWSELQAESQSTGFVLVSVFIPSAGQDLGFSLDLQRGLF